MAADTRGGSVLERIQALDPERDYEEGYRLHAAWAFPWDTARALELALLRTYAVPSVGDLLHATQEFEQRTQKRYDDTVLLLSAPAEHGFESPQGRAAISRINRIHARFDIADEDYAYVLSTFVAVPARWIERFGWRPMSAHEQVITQTYYAELGRRMGIRGLPPTFAETLAFSAAYEEEHFGRTRGTEAVGTATRELFVRWFAPVPARVTRTAVHALCDEPLLRAFGWDPAPRPVVRAAEAALRARARVVRHLPDRRAGVPATETGFVRTDPATPVERLGPSGAPLPAALLPRPEAAGERPRAGG